MLHPPLQLGHQRHSTETKSGMRKNIHHRKRKKKTDAEMSNEEAALVSRWRCQRIVSSSIFRAWRKILIMSPLPTSTSCVRWSQMPRCRQNKGDGVLWNSCKIRDFFKSTNTNTIGKYRGCVSCFDSKCSTTLQRECKDDQGSQSKGSNHVYSERGEIYVIIEPHHQYAAENTTTVASWRRKQRASGQDDRNGKWIR